MYSHTLANAGKNETQDIINIVTDIHEKTNKYQSIISSFAITFPGKRIIDAKIRDGSNRSTHHDICILVQDIHNNNETWFNVEHKGSINVTAKSKATKPWALGVQFANLSCIKFTMAKKYAQKWYDILISSDKLKNEFEISAEIPTFNDWYSKDCCSQGDPKTSFGIELKNKVRLKTNGSSLLNKRKEVIDNLTLDENDIEIFKNEVLPIVKDVLEQKDYFLIIKGLLCSDNFNVSWYPKFIINDIISINVIKKKDIEFEFKCSDNVSFNGILRWGKGAGFSCLRIDFK
jgi:hypothetical protein